MIEELERIWVDQEDFNRNFRQPPTTFEERSTQTRDISLEAISEIVELLRTMNWKKHRKAQVVPNVSHSEEELADIFKYLITLCQIHNVTPKRLFEIYWRKSMVCRQRYSEEWVKTIDRPCVLLDLDQVLCDYVDGILTFIRREFAGWVSPSILDGVQRQGWVNKHTLKIEEGEWAMIKWQLRTSDAKRDFPVMPGAKEFVDWCKSRGWLVIVLTSRPIDVYPNLYSDTLAWLHKHQLEPDFIWWANEKASRAYTVKKNVVFAVDDHAKFAMQYRDADIACYWLTQSKPQDEWIGIFPDSIVPVRSLSDIRRHYEETHPCPSTQTKDIVHTPHISEKNPTPTSIVAPTD